MIKSKKFLYLILLLCNIVLCNSNEMCEPIFNICNGSSKKSKQATSNLEEIKEKEENIKNKENKIKQREKKLKEKEKQINDYENSLIEKGKKLDIDIENKEKKITQLQNELIKIQKEKGNFEKFLDKDPLYVYEKPTLIGLNNIGATCFMNSTLQCLSQTKALTNYFLNKKNEKRVINNNIAVINKNDLQLSPDYLELIHKLWDINESKPFSPNKFMNKINDMNPLFKKGQAGDSKDFIIFVLEQLHKELKKSLNLSNINNPSSNKELNQYDKNNAFNHFFNDFKKDTSIISDVFFGITETTNECQNCKNNYNLKGLKHPIVYNYQIFNCLIFPLEEVKNWKNNNNSNQNYNIFMPNNVVSINDCFNYYQKPEYFTGANQNYCNNCKQLFDSIYTNKIFVGPNILVLILNRGKANIYDVKLNFTEIIDITQFVLGKEMPLILYRLCGVITHIGQSGPSAHFVASCKSPIDNKWYRYNDAMVNPIDNFQKEVIDFGTPYILFYQKINI